MSTPQSKKAVFYGDIKRKPNLPLPDSNGIPVELRTLARWVGFNWLWKNDAWTKVPRALIQPSDAKKFPAWNLPAGWCDFKVVVLRARGEGTAGVGFVLGGGFVGIDLDNVRDPETTVLLPWAKELMDAAGGFVDVSPSGTGVKLIGRGQWMGRTKAAHPGGGDVEVYGSGRFFTVTGQNIGGPNVTDLNPVLAMLAPLLPAEPKKSAATGVPGPTPVASTLGDAELIAKASAANRTGDKFRRLWAGELTAAGGDHSAADLALCNLLAFWAGPSPDRIDAPFRQSALMRPKWDDKHKADGTTYGGTTIGRALSGRTDFYTGRGSNMDIPEAPAYLPTAVGEVSDGTAPPPAAPQGRERVGRGSTPAGPAVPRAGLPKAPAVAGLVAPLG